MKKYLREVMANPEYRKTFEENEIFAMVVMAMTYEIQSEVEVVHFLCKHLKDLCKELEDANTGVFEITGVIDTNTPIDIEFRDAKTNELKQSATAYNAVLNQYPKLKQEILRLLFMLPS